MPRITVIVDYEINDGSAEAFETVIRDHARRTLIEEPGCIRFDVLRPRDGAGALLKNRIMLVEVYADDAAFAAHGDSARLAALRPVLAPLTKSRHLTVAEMIDDRPEDQGLTPDELNASNDG